MSRQQLGFRPITSLSGICLTLPYAGAKFRAATSWPYYPLFCPQLTGIRVVTSSMQSQSLSNQNLGLGLGGQFGSSSGKNLEMSSMRTWEGRESQCVEEKNKANVKGGVGLRKDRGERKRAFWPRGDPWFQGPGCISTVEFHEIDSGIVFI